MVKIVGLGQPVLDAIVHIPSDWYLGALETTRGARRVVDDGLFMCALGFVEEFGVTWSSGGSSGNTLRILAQLGADAILCGQISQDQYARQYMDEARAAGLRLSMNTAPHGSTRRALCLITPDDGQRTFFSCPGIDDHLTTLDPCRGAFRGARIAHFEGFAFLDEAACALAREAITFARSSGAMVSLDVSDPSVARAIPRDLRRIIEEGLIDILFMNDEEVCLVAGQPQSEWLFAAIQISTWMQDGLIVFKRGGEGSGCCSRSGGIHFPATPTTVVDTTGAGDAYAAGFLYGLLREWEYERCGRFASEVASLVVAQTGATLRDVSQLLLVRDRFHALTQT